MPPLEQEYNNFVDQIPQNDKLIIGEYSTTDEGKLMVEALI